MNKQTTTVRSAQTQAFLEYHYYEGGLRTAHIAFTAERPTWAPPAEWVGFRDEVALTGTDVILEVIKFASDEQTASWVGLYRHSPDQRYGDRQNHAGIGVWLLNQFPSNPELLIEGLEKLLEILPSASKPDFTSKASAFLREYLDGYLSPFRQLPTPLDGIQAANSQVLSTDILSIEKISKDWTSVLEDIVFRIFFLSPCPIGTNRVLVLLAGENSSDSAKTYRGKGFSAEFLRAIPSALEAQASQLVQAQSKAREGEATIAELDQRVDQLKSDYDEAFTRASSLQAAYDELKASLEEDDDRRRFTTLHQAISELNSRFPELAREIHSIKRELVSEVRNHRITQNQVAVGSSLDSGHHHPMHKVDGARIKHKPTPPWWHSISWWKVTLLVTILATTAVLLYYLIKEIMTLNS